MSEAQEAPVKRGPGRPRKNPGVERDAKREPAQKPATALKMRAKPNWEDMDETLSESPDRLAIAADLIPEGMSLQWITSTVFGQEMPTHRANFERKGWTPVHQDDFNGQFNGRWMQRDKEGEITVDGLVLMVRPKQMTDRATLQREFEARNQVLRKEAEMRGGDMPGVSLDSQHPSALRINKVGKSLERIDVPKE